MDFGDVQVLIMIVLFCVLILCLRMIEKDDTGDEHLVFLDESEYVLFVDDKETAELLSKQKGLL